MSEDQEKMKALAASFSKRMTEVDVAAEHDFINGILEDIAEPTVRVPEPVFREIFLPYFIGEKEASSKEQAIAHWMGLVGSCSEPAEVVDLRGEVLFKVPPMYDTARINVNRGEGRSTPFAAIFEVYEDQSKIHPNLGNRFLAEELAKKATQALPGIKTEHSWIPVLKYYKLLPEDAVSNTTAQPSDDDLVLGDD